MQTLNKKFSVVLVNVSRETNQIQFPIGLSVIVNALKKHQINPQVLDLITLPIEERVTSFQNLIPNEPAIYGFGMMIGGNHLKEVERYVKIIRSKHPKNRIVYGGSFPSSMPDLMLQRCSCDFLVHGEGERAFPALIKAIWEGNYFPSGISGVFYRHNGKIIGTKNKRIAKLDAFSNPDFSQFNMNFYIDYLLETGQSWEIMASRGCLGNCTFCYKFMGNGLSVRKVDFVLDEIEFIIENFNLSKFYFVDENFLQINKYFMEFIEKKNKRGLDFSFIGQSRIDAIDEEKCDIGSANGLICISTGVESVSQNTLNRINKRITVHESEKKLEIMRRFNIRPSVNFIIGFPWETEQDYKDLYDFIIRNGLQKHTKISYLTPLPSTKLFQECIEKGLISDPFEYACSLNNLYWERHINLTRLPDEVLDYYFNILTRLGKRNTVKIKSPKYATKIRELH
ncbi:MAG: B12-binding domain-containing radical SAM protein [Promethearchaeota archaeon]|jgi:radical SAM superfamily enzyme YgiQ (UPF0313 family)